MARVRSRGEGSISKRRDGRFEVRLSAGTEDGKRKRVHLYAKSRADAVKLLSQARQQHKPGTLRSGQTGETVEHFLNRWLEQHVAKTKRTRTLASYEQNVRLHINPVIGKVRLAELTPEHVDAVMAAASDKGLSPTTCRLVRITLGAALNRAMKWRMVGVENVVRMTDGPKVDRKEQTFLDPEQARTLLGAFADHELEAFVRVAIFCGLRVGELQGLRWQDVDLERRQLRVVNQLRSAGEGLEDVKTESSVRSVDMPATVATMLKGHRLRQMSAQDAATRSGIPWLNEWGLVFTREHGAPTCRTTLKRDFDRVVDKVGLPRLRLHDLRHTCASLLFAEGVSAKTVQEILGHSKISTTMDIYTHVIPAVRRDAADALERLLG